MWWSVAISMDNQEYDNIAGARRVIKVLKLVGLWRYKGAVKIPYIIYSFLLHFIFTFPYTIMMCMEVVQAPDLEKFSNIMYMTLTELALLAKVVNVWCYSQVLVDFFGALAKDPHFRLQNAEERLCSAAVQRHYCWIASSYFAMSIITVSSTFVGVLFSADYELPYPYAPPFDWRTERGYRYAYFYELLAMPITCLSNCACDMIQCYMLLQISLCFKFISERLDRMGESTSPGGFSEEKFRMEFVEIVRIHARTKQLSEQCERYVSFPYLVQILCSSFVLCFSAYRIKIVNISENPGQFLGVIQFVIVMCLQIFLPSFYGNEIIINSSGLNNSIYNANWTACSPGMRKLLVIYMEMLQRPVELRAGNFFVISLVIFSKTLNNTYSLIALLLNMNE